MGEKGIHSCPDCGCKLNNNEKKCPYCGKDLASSQEDAKRNVADKVLYSKRRTHQWVLFALLYFLIFVFVFTAVSAWSLAKQRIRNTGAELPAEMTTSESNEESGYTGAQGSEVVSLSELYEEIKDENGISLATLLSRRETNIHSNLPPLTGYGYDLDGYGLTDLRFIWEGDDKLYGLAFRRDDRVDLLAVWEEEEIIGYSLPGSDEIVSEKVYDGDVLIGFDLDHDGKADIGTVSRKEDVSLIG